MIWICGDKKKAKKEYKILKNANLGGKPTFFSKKKIICTNYGVRGSIW